MTYFSFAFIADGLYPRQNFLRTLRRKFPFLRKRTQVFFGGIPIPQRHHFMFRFFRRPRQIICRRQTIALPFFIVQKGNAVPTSENSVWITTLKRDSLCTKSNFGQKPAYLKNPPKSTSTFKLSGGCCGVRNVTIYQGRYINFSTRSTFVFSTIQFAARSNNAFRA